MLTVLFIKSFFQYIYVELSNIYKHEIRKMKWKQLIDGFISNIYIIVSGIMAIRIVVTKQSDTQCFLQRSGLNVVLSNKLLLIFTNPNTGPDAQL